MPPPSDPSAPPPPALRLRWLPGPRLPALLASAAVACLVARLVLGTGMAVNLLAAGMGLGLLVWLAWDGWRARSALRLHPPELLRPLPNVLPLGVAHAVPLQLRLPAESPMAWHGELFDGLDPGFDSVGLPLRFTLQPGQQQTLSYHLTPRHRGAARMAPATLRLRSPAGGWTLQLALGPTQALRVFPNFAEIARFAWLASDHRLAKIGIRAATARGTGSDFRQLADYQPGDPVRHIDWKASQRRGRPVVRQYQDERDQRVIFLLDCGRRMRADDRSGPHQAQHFDHVLNALVLTAHVALKAGDEVGLMTFGHSPGQGRQLAPRKGQTGLDGLLAAVHDLMPSTEHPDYEDAARALMKAMPRRALVVLLTNLRDEDASELAPALRLLRTRHLTMVTSLREPALAELAAQGLDTPQAVAEVATAHWLGQAREQAFRRLDDPQRLAIDVLPPELAGALVTRYLAIKRQQLL